ncbi:MAG TPA: hypothetical protein VNL15_05545 [Dehalococcoidia bacterium]|nr:hypothetical protein [Dehalococcoidia bacterium]
MAIRTCIAVAAGLSLLLLAACGDPTPPLADQTPEPTPIEETLVMFPVEGTTISGSGFDYVQYLFEVADERLWRLRGRSTFGPFSPDGKFLIERRCCDNRGLSIVDLSTGKSRPILEGDLSSTIWSPDSDRIVFTQLVNGQLHGPYVISKDGSNLVQLADLRLPVSISWSPDGKYISAQVYGELPHKLLLLDLNSGEIISAVESLYGFAWSPDGKRLAYGNETGLYLYDPETRERRQLTVLPGDASPAGVWSHPLWSPDSAALLFRYGDLLPTGYIGQQQAYYLIGVNDPGSPVSLGPMLRPGWSPDGRHIAYMSYGCLTKNWDIFLYDVASGAERRVTNMPDKIKEGPEWSPSGDSLLFSTFDRLYRFDIKSGELKTILTRGENGSSNIHLHSGSWSADGRFVLLGTGDHGICD